VCSNRHGERVLIGVDGKTPGLRTGVVPSRHQAKGNSANDQNGKENKGANPVPDFSFNTHA
jgi:hypothetical protein